LPTTGCHPRESGGLSYVADFGFVAGLAEAAASHRMSPPRKRGPIVRAGLRSCGGVRRGIRCPFPNPDLWRGADSVAVVIHGTTHVRRIGRAPWAPAKAGA